MLDIFKNNKGKILNLFFKDTSKEYYLREIAKILGKEPSLFQKAINSLVKEGILKDKRRGNMRFFRLNKNYPLYEELKKIVSKIFGIEAELKGMVDGFNDIKYAFIFGSIARGREYSESDIDLMLVGRVNQDKLISQVTELENKLEREVNYHIYNKQELTKKLKNKNYFLTKVFGGPKIILKGNINELTGFSWQKVYW